MTISIIGGSPIIEPNIEQKLQRKLSHLVKGEEHILFYFHARNSFSLMCEWVARKLQAKFPNKCIESVIAGVNVDPSMYPRVRYARLIVPDIEPKTPRQVLKWMVDQSDYVFAYVHPILCSVSSSLCAYRYACSQLKDRCVNLATEEALAHIYEKVPTLVRWERCAFEGLQQGVTKKVMAEKLGVSVCTLHNYEIAARRRLVNEVYPPDDPKRKCAILGFSAMVLYGPEKDMLSETIQYLVQDCGVTEFIVPYEAYSNCSALMVMLRFQQRYFLHQKSHVEISTIRMVSEENCKWRYPETKGVYYYRSDSKKVVSRMYEERKAMIDIADVVICNAKNPYRSGFGHARRRHIPVINLADSKYYRKGQEGVL